jgi:hypothetical protein
MFVQRKHIEAFVDRLDARFGRPGRLYFVGETTQVVEGWRAWTDHVAFTADVAPARRLAFDQAVQHVADALEVTVLDESPADLIPLPGGYEERARPVQAMSGRRGQLHLCHFDPYSVAFRFIARGDESDYHLVLQYLEHGWITLDEMNALLTGLLPRFTCETIQQDPAEFQRKYKGLLQMRSTLRPGTIHRPF